MTTSSTELEVIAQGRFLKLVRSGRWEYATRTKPIKSAFIAALTDDGRLILTQEYRIPIGKVIVGFPAGLVGDGDDPDESLETAVKRELVEEAGYEARTVTLLTAGPSSAGAIDEVISIVLAEGLTQVGPGGGLADENIRITPVPLPEVHAWLEAREREGCQVDPKVYTGLYFILRERGGLRAV